MSQEFEPWPTGGVIPSEGEVRLFDQDGRAIHRAVVQYVNSTNAATRHAPEDLDQIRSSLGPPQMRLHGEAFEPYIGTFALRANSETEFELKNTTHIGANVRTGFTIRIRQTPSDWTVASCGRWHAHRPH